MTPLRRVLVLLALSVLFGAIAADAVTSREERVMSFVGEPVDLLVTGRPVVKGGSLSRAALAVRSVPARWAPPAALSRTDQAEGAVAAVALPAGSYLVPGTWMRPADATSSPLRPGERVATVIATAPAAGVVPGSRVDVIVSEPGRGARMELESAEVLSLRVIGAGAGDGGRRVEADLRTDLKGALRLAGASGVGADVRLLPIGARRG